MIKEKHVLKNPYNYHALSRYIDVYEVSANRCYSVPESGYKGTEATLVDEPAWNEKLSSYSITGATLTGNNFILNNDVTAQANYETAKNVTLQTDGHGTIAANRTSGFIGDQVTLSNTANAGYAFAGYSITGANLTGNKFNFIGNNVTAKAMYNMTGIIYYTNNNYYQIQKPSPSEALPTGRTINLNIDITPFNYATVKYTLPIIGPDSITVERLNVTAYSIANRKNDYRLNPEHNFDSYGMTSAYGVDGSNTSANFKFIIDRSAARYSAFKNGSLTESDYIRYTYTGTWYDEWGDGHFGVITATADDITKIKDLYWYSYQGYNSMSGLSVAGFTSYNDAYNY